MNTPSASLLPPSLSLSHVQIHTQLQKGELFLDNLVNRSASLHLYKACTSTEVQSDFTKWTSHYFVLLCASDTHLRHHRWVFLLKFFLVEWCEGTVEPLLIFHYTKLYLDFALDFFVAQTFERIWIKAVFGSWKSGIAVFSLPRINSLIVFLFSHCSMKHRRLLLSLPLLPTITEILEDLPVHPSSSQCTQSSQTLEDYMSSIQALACPVEAPSCGPVRLQRSPRTRLFSKAQMKLSVSTSLPRGSPRALRTSRPSSLSLNNTEEFSLRTRMERDCKGKDPVDWLFGQIRTWGDTMLLLFLRPVWVVNKRVWRLLCRSSGLKVWQGP